jgi:hypothetical protein
MFDHADIVHRYTRADAIRRCDGGPVVRFGVHVRNDNVRRVAV